MESGRNLARKRVPLASFPDHARSSVHLRRIFKAKRIQRQSNDHHFLAIFRFLLHLLVRYSVTRLYSRHAPQGPTGLPFQKPINHTRYPVHRGSRSGSFFAQGFSPPFWTDIRESEAKPKALFQRNALWNRISAGNHSGQH